MDLCGTFFFPGGTNCFLNIQEIEEIRLRDSVVVFKPRHIFNCLPLN